MPGLRRRACALVAADAGMSLPEPQLTFLLDSQMLNVGKLRLLCTTRDGTGVRALGAAPGEPNLPNVV